MMGLLMDLFFRKMHSFSLYKTLTGGFESFGLLVNYCDNFISCFELSF